MIRLLVLITILLPVTLLAGISDSKPTEAATLPGHPLVRLPYPVGSTWSVSCGYECHQNNSAIPSNLKRLNNYAVDFVPRPSSGTTVYAPVSGTIDKIECSGSWVYINAANGWTVVLAHLASVSVKAGQTVKYGQPIGVMGKTCGANGVHLHMVLLHDDPADGQPRSYPFGSIGCYDDGYFAKVYTTSEKPLKAQNCPRLDFNANGCADIIARDAAYAALRLYRGNCNGGLNSGLQIGTGWDVFDWLLAPGDFSGDGCADIVGRRADDGTLRLYKGNCTGGFVSGGTNIQIGTGWNVFDWLLAPGDFNGDKCADIIARVPTDGTLKLYKGNCAGGFNGNSVIKTSSGATSTGWNALNWLIAAGDFNGNGCPDIIARSASDGTLRLYRGACSDRIFSSVQIGTGWDVFDWLTGPGDMNGDGCADVVGRRRADGTLRLYQGDCEVGFRGQNIQIGTGWNSINWIM